jgi:hypothetical protein
MGSSASIAIIEITDGSDWRGVSIHTGCVEIFRKSIELAKMAGFDPPGTHNLGRFKLVSIDIPPEDCPIEKSVLWPFLEGLQKYLDGLQDLGAMEPYQWMYNRSGDCLASVTGQGGDRD